MFFLIFSSLPKPIFLQLFPSSMPFPDSYLTLLYPKKTLSPLKALFFLPKNEDPLPAFTCSLFISSCKSSPVPAISQSPSSTTTMARWWYLWPHVPACSAPPKTSPHSSKNAANSPGIVTLGKKKCMKEEPQMGVYTYIIIYIIYIF